MIGTCRRVDVQGAAERRWSIGYRREAGSANDRRTLLSTRVIAPIRSPGVRQGDRHDGHDHQSTTGSPDD
jgi:hypothetical protein